MDPFKTADPVGGMYPHNPRAPVRQGSQISCPFLGRRRFFVGRKRCGQWVIKASGAGYSIPALGAPGDHNPVMISSGSSIFGRDAFFSAHPPDWAERWNPSQYHAGGFFIQQGFQIFLQQLERPSPKRKAAGGKIYQGRKRGIITAADKGVQINARAPLGLFLLNRRRPPE